MGFIQKFLGNAAEAEISITGLEAFVARGLREGLNLEYKAKDALRSPERVAREVAAFVNSDGGLLILGISETKERPRGPDKIDWDDDPAHTPEWIETVLLNGIHPPVVGVRILQVRNDKGGAVWLVDAPPSSNPPHMAPDGLYYYRSNFSVLRMEHYQVADAFGKRRRPVLRPTLTASRLDTTGKSASLTYGMANEGRALAKWVMIHLKFVGCTIEQEKMHAAWESLRHSPGEDGLEEWFVTHESPMSVLHPEMMQTFGTLTVRLTSPLALIVILVGAEDSPTDSYVTMLGERWLEEKTRPDSKRAADLSLLAAGENVEANQVSKWQEQFAADAKEMGVSNLGKLGVRLLVALGSRYLNLLMSQAAKGGTAMPDAGDETD